MNFKRNLLVAISILLVMATAVAYAAWSDTLDIKGTVTTAKFDVRFAELAEDGEELKVDDLTKWTFEVGEQIVDSDIEYSQEADLLTVTLVNAVSGETYEAPITVKNVGEIDAILQGLEITNLGADAETSTHFEVTLLDLDGNVLDPEADELDVDEITPDTEQTYTIKIKVKSDTAEGIGNLTESFAIKLTYGQVAAEAEDGE